MTVSGWRHVEETHYGCSANLEGEGSWWVTPCDCTTPTPDPASPCGREYLWTTGVLPCMWYPTQHPEQSGHPHVPTRCTCGHPIEALIL